MEKRGLNIYFIHSNNIDYNRLIYLPVLRSSVLSHHTLVFPTSEENREIYYKDIMGDADLYVVELTKPDAQFGIQLKYALTTKKPILALAQKSVGYEAKYQRLLQNVVGYSTEAEMRYFVETFANTYKGKMFNGQVDPTVILGVINT